MHGDDPGALRFPPVVVGSLVILAGVAAGGALYFMRPVMVPLILALLFSYLVSPLVDTVQVRLRTPRPLAVLVALVVVGLLVFLPGALISSSVRSLAAKGPAYEARLVQMGEGAMATLQGWGVPLDAAALRGSLEDLPVAGMVLEALNQAASSLTNVLLVLVFVVYLVAGRTPNQEQRGIWREIDARIKRYIAVKVIGSAATGLLVGGILAILGLDLAVVFGLLAFLLNFVPSVGSVVATLLPLAVALVQFDAAWRIVLVLALPGALQLVIGNVIEPRFLGSALELHPITILLALVFWGMLWGVTGMLLAAPITAVLRIVLERLDATRPLADLLVGRLPGTGDGSGAP